MTELICIVCPCGCHLLVDEKDGYKVTGNDCPRGEIYGRIELTTPTRVITSSVPIDGAIHRRCPVKTDCALPKSLIFDAVRQLKEVELTVPVHMGQVVIQNICGTSASFIATREMRWESI